MTLETLRVDRIGAVARIALDRPEKRNAANDQTMTTVRGPPPPVTYLLRSLALFPRPVRWVPSNGGTSLETVAKI